MLITLVLLSMAWSHSTGLKVALIIVTPKINIKNLEQKFQTYTCSKYLSDPLVALALSGAICVNTAFNFSVLAS